MVIVRDNSKKEINKNHVCTRAQAHTHMLTTTYIYIKITVNMKHKNRKHLDLRTEKDISPDILEELAEIVLKNNIFNFHLKIYRQKRSTAIGTKFAPPYFILFMILKKAFLKIPI